MSAQDHRRRQVAAFCAQVRAFARVLEQNSTNGDHRRQGQELNQSPLLFMEATQLSESQQFVARKDEIIRVRNAQVPS